ncbi:reverse transcriptase domain-containing protein [Tanacetum coccineum]|uniref:Reverse transcriptase domain-containing protein n=1 Tax=Tanacetum coccineum TaxID=301880 RepID=A0ABQ5H5N0_9ASTR
MAMRGPIYISTLPNSSKFAEEMRQAFVSRFFQLAMLERLMGEIRGFTQHPNESLVEAWLRMKDLLRICHGHGLGRGTIIKIFYHGLDNANQAL